MASQTSGTSGTAPDLLAFVAASPTPYHAVAESVRRLQVAGFEVVEETGRFPRSPGRYVLARGGALVAWDSRAGDVSAASGRQVGFRVVGAHTDSPNLRIKPRPDLARVGWQQLGVEPYGGLLHSTWLDRDLGLAGRVAVRDGSTPDGWRTALFHDDRRLARVPALAIHLDRSVNEGLALNPQSHLSPVWGLGETPGDFTAYVADRVGCEAGEVLGWDVMAHVVEPGAVLGLRGELYAAPRLDNLASCHAGLAALVAAGDAGEAAHGSGSDARIPVLALFDHEEIGSTSSSGAGSTLLASVLERVVLARGGDRDDVHAAFAASIVASADMAHATHPNYAERHEPQHLVLAGGGPVLKVNANVRYATDAGGAAVWRLACEQAGVPLQVFVTRSDLPCGSTIGPMTAALLGGRTVDVGAPLLSMHSARELGAVADVPLYAAALTAFLAPAG